MSITDLSPSKPRMCLLLRYGLVGVLTNLVIYGGYLAITSYDIAPKVAMTVMYAVGAAFGFVGHRKWTFVHNGNVRAAAMRLTVAHGCGYLLNYFILLTFVDKFEYPHQFVQAVSIVFVAAFLFLLFKFWVFRSSNVISQ